MKLFSVKIKWTSCLDFVMVPLIETFITAQNFDIICVSETFLDSSSGISDTRINLTFAS